MKIEEKKYKFKKNEPLNAFDNEHQTYGCRCYNPDICRNYTSETCGLTNDSHICTTPSRKWKQIYKKLSAIK